MRIASVTTRRPEGRVVISTLIVKAPRRGRRDASPLADEAFDRRADRSAEVVKCSWSLEEIGKMGGKGGLMPGRLLDRVGEFGGMGGGEHDHRRRWVARQRLARARGRRRRCADRGDSEDVAPRVWRFPSRVRSRRCAGIEFGGGSPRSGAGPSSKRPDCCKIGHQPADRRRVAAAGLEQQAFEIRRDLDVHRRRLRGAGPAQLVGAARQRAGENVVFVGGDDQPLDRQAHALGDIAGEDVAEIAGRNGEGHRAMRRAERDGAGEIIDDLGGDARPVDRIDAGRASVGRGRRMVEQALHHRLAIVERAFDGDDVDIVGGDRRSSAGAAPRRRGRADRE